MGCPCCARRTKANAMSKTWQRLCDDCAYYVFRLATCPHELQPATFLVPERARSVPAA